MPNLTINHGQLTWQKILQELYSSSLDPCSRKNLCTPVGLGENTLTFPNKNILLHVIAIMYKE